MTSRKLKTRTLFVKKKEQHIFSTVNVNVIFTQFALMLCDLMLRNLNHRVKPSGCAVCYYCYILHFLTMIENAVTCAYTHILRQNAAVEDYGSSLRAKRGLLIAASCPDVVWLSGKVVREGSVVCGDGLSFAPPLG